MSPKPSGSSRAFDVTGISPSKIIDAGDLELGSGVLLQIRGTLDRLPSGAVLEVRSRRPGFDVDVAAWCRLTSNQLLLTADAGDHWRLFIQKGRSGTGAELADWGIRLPLNEDGSASVRDWLVGRRSDPP